MKKHIITLASALLLSTSTFASPPDNAVDVMKHLEFSGYTVSSNTFRIKADHNEYLNMLLKSYRGGILTIAYFGANANGKVNKAALMDVVNELNAQASAARYYIDGDGDLVIEAYYPGEYERARFATFLDVFQLEKDNLLHNYKALEAYLD